VRFDIGAIGSTQNVAIDRRGVASRNSSREMEDAPLHASMPQVGYQVREEEGARSGACGFRQKKGSQWQALRPYFHDAVT
jgi:hypothetical protein